MPPFAPGDANEFSRPLDLAFAHLGVEETPGHPNRGKMVDEYIKHCKLDPDAQSYEWCCAGVIYWCHKTGLLWVPRTASVQKLWDLLKDKRSTIPRIGDAFVHLKPTGKGHIGLVASFDQDFIYTVEGNSNEKGSRTGNAVVRGKRSRTSGYIRGYIRLDRERVIVS